MLHIIKDREYATHISNHLRFSREDGSGFSFDADKDGTVYLQYGDWCEKKWSLRDPMPEDYDNDIALEHLALCIFDPEFDEFVERGYVTNEHNYWEPAIGKCDCGREVTLDGDYGHGIDCECGRIYNMSGQELAPRSQWEERWDEDSTQPYWAEFGYAEGQM
jgi:hypothetical protein